MGSIKRLATGIVVGSALALTAACGSGGSGDNASGGSSASAGANTSPDASPMADPAAGLVGPGCAAYAKQVPDGAGSVTGMGADPVATAAGNNPLLKTLASAVSGQLNPKVDLVSTLNNGDFTIFAPVDAAFAKLPAKTVAALKQPKNASTLTSILTYHVVSGQLAPAQVDGTHKTVEGGTVTVTGAGDNLEVNGADVICGGVRTANATVYLIDAVLQPQM